MTRSQASGRMPTDILDQLQALQAGARAGTGAARLNGKTLFAPSRPASVAQSDQGSRQSDWLDEAVERARQQGPATPFLPRLDFSRKASAPATPKTTVEDASTTTSVFAADAKSLRTPNAKEQLDILREVSARLEQETPPESAPRSMTEGRAEAPKSPARRSSPRRGATGRAKVRQRPVAQRQAPPFAPQTPASVRVSQRPSLEVPSVKAASVAPVAPGVAVAGVTAAAPKRTSRIASMVLGGAAVAAGVIGVAALIHYLPAIAGGISIAIAALGGPVGIGVLAGVAAGIGISLTVWAISRKVRVAMKNRADRRAAAQGQAPA